MERKARRGRLWKIFGSEQFLREMWRYFTLKRAWARKDFADAAQENKKEYKGIVNKSLPSKKFLEKKCGYRLQCPNNCAKRNSGKKESSVNGPLERLQEAYDQVAMEDIGPLQDTFEKEHGLLKEDYRTDVWVWEA